MSNTKQMIRGSRVTLAKVAEDAGVSTATASLILAKRNGWIEQFHPDTVRRVQASAAKLEYRRNLFAGALPSGDPPFFAVFLGEAETEPENGHYWALQGALLEGVSAAAERQNVFAVTSTIQGDTAETGARRVSAIMDGGVFGAIFRTSGTEVERLIRTRLNQRRATVVIFPSQVAEWPTNAIDVDNLAVGRMAAKLLAAGKRRKWVLVQYKHMTDAHRLRGEGFKQLAREVGLKPSIISLPIEFDEDSAAGLLAPQFERGAADGIYAVDSVSSVGAVLGCLRARLMPGIDCSIVGCDASQWKVPGLPRITSVDVSWREVGVLALEQLLRARNSNCRFRTMLLKPRVVEADTCPVPAKFKPQRRQARPITYELSSIAI